MIITPDATNKSFKLTPWIADLIYTPNHLRNKEMVTLSPEHILSALIDSESEWPVLVGEQWSKIEHQYRELRDQLDNTTGPIQMRTAAELVQLLAPYTDARKRLKEAIATQTEAGLMALILADLANQLCLDSTISAQLRGAAQPNSPIRYVWQSSPTKATSLKLANMIISFETE
jgi:hypothetical protein